jgi:tetratricopeptide (TPR) repeat protein
MSSLLDILQKRAGPPAADNARAGPTSPESHMQTVELHLAVDNRGTGEQFTESHPQAPAPDPTVGLQEEAPAPGVESILAAERQPDTDTTAADLVDPAGDPADATQSFLDNQRKLRVRRNTSLLVGSLILILLAVTTAISILLQYTADRGSEQSVVISPEALQGVPAQPVASDPVPAQDVRPLRKEVTTPQAAPPKATAEKDPDWFETPAIELPDTGTQIKISRGTTENPLFPKLSEAWNAFQGADYMRAETLYREVQAAEPGNVNAMLGLAAIALRSGREQEAQSLYRAVLESDPKNSAAVAALSTLPAGASGNGDTSNESKLKSLLREQPGSASLYFALGVQYLGTGRWPEAQQAFFEAVRNEPTNAVYAYNLAVSLDQLNQASAAAAYYERALTLANGNALFDIPAARQRLDTLRAAAL